MTEPEAPAGRSWRYQFTLPDGTELETGEFNGDDAAETWARDASRSHDAPVVIRRHSAHVDSWEYVTEVDERQ